MRTQKDKTQPAASVKTLWRNKGHKKEKQGNTNSRPLEEQLPMEDNYTAPGAYLTKEDT
jgi:hypothetical protein